MFLQSIDVDGAMPAGDAGAARDLALLAAGIDTHFLQTGTTLAAAIGIVDRLIGGLGGIAAALGEETAGAAIADLCSAADRLADLPNASVANSRRIDALARTTRKLSGDVLGIHRALRSLTIFGFTIKIAAAGERQFDGFVERMTERLAAGECELDVFMSRLKTLSQAVAGVQQADRLLVAECATVGSHVPRRLSDDARRLTAYLADVAVLGRNVTTIAHEVQAKVAVVLGALQIGDSTRQRLEHVVAALQMLDTCGAGNDSRVAGPLLRMLAAHLRETDSAYRRETGALLQSLRDLVHDARNLRTLIEEQADGGGGAFLAGLEQGIDEVRRVTARLQKAETGASAMALVIAGTVAALSDGTERVDRIRTDVQDLSINTRLLCCRHATVGRGIAVVAVEIDGQARSLGDSMIEIARSITQLDEIAASFENAGGSDLGSRLDGAIAVVRTACRRTEEVTVTGADDARHLIALIDGVAADLERKMTMADLMAAAADALSSDAGDAGMQAQEPSPALVALLERVWALYTMAEEREIHILHLPPGIQPPVVSACVAGDADDDDEDDGLF